MTAYLIRRLLLMIPTLLLASIVVFLMIRIIPGDVIDIMLAEQEGVTQIDRETIEKKLGLDVPIYVQYWRWSTNIITHGDLGKSLWREESVTSQIVSKLPVSIELGLLAILTGIFISIPIGVYSAIRQDTIGDYVARSFAILCISIPGFWMGTMIMVFPSIWWRWSPSVIYIPFLDNPVKNLEQFIIPAVVLGMHLAGTSMRMTRTMMLEVLRQDYIKTAWSKGLREGIIVIRHAMKNALIPVITIIGLQLPLLVGGAVIIEQIFCLPGVGRLMLDSINSRDYTVVSGVMLIMTFAILLGNLFVDLSYGILDPRVKYSGKN